MKARNFFVQACGLCARSKGRAPFLRGRRVRPFHRLFPLLCVGESASRFEVSLKSPIIYGFGKVLVQAELRTYSANFLEFTREFS
jgi:hypothetical protein